MRAHVCVAGKMITVVVPDELQPGDVLAVPSPTPSHPAHPTSQRTPGLTRTLPPPGRGLDGGPPCSHAHPHACPAPPKRTEGLCTSCLAHAHCALHVQVTAPPKRKTRPSDVVRKQQRQQAREERRQQELPSRGWEDDPP